MLGHLSSIHPIAVNAFKSIGLEDRMNGWRYKVLLFQVLQVVGVM